MSQLRRFHGGGTVLVSVGLIDALDSLYGIGSDDCMGVPAEMACEIERVIVAPQMGRPMIPTTSAAFCDLRNALDLTLIVTECIESGGEPIGVDCEFCEWCQTLVMRDWCDWVLDRAFPDRYGVHAYIEPIDYDPAAFYDETWRQVNAKYKRETPCDIA